MAKLERLDKILSNMGFGSRKQVKNIIKNGRITIDGEIANDNSLRVDPNRDIRIDGIEVNYREFIYLMLNKPQNVVSATEDNIHETVIDLLEYEHLIFEPFPVGRLDKDTEGLLIITNDGKFAHSITSPNREVEKTYYAQIDGYVDQEDIKAFENGLILDDGYKTKPAILEIIDSGVISEVLVSITEGKFHQVKRMFKARNMEVKYLKRLKIGDLILDDDLYPGEYRELTEEEIESFKDN